MGRKKMWSEELLGRFPEGTIYRIHAVLAENEPMTEFIRVAVEKELQLRERGNKPKLRRVK